MLFSYLFNFLPSPQIPTALIREIHFYYREINIIDDRSDEIVARYFHDFCHEGHRSCWCVFQTVSFQPCAEKNWTRIEISRLIRARRKSYLTSVYQSLNKPNVVQRRSFTHFTWCSSLSEVRYSDRIAASISSNGGTWTFVWESGGWAETQRKMFTWKEYV